MVAPFRGHGCGKEFNFAQKVKTKCYGKQFY